MGEPGDERERSDARQPQPSPPDPLADTVRPTDEDLAVTRKLSTSGAKRFEPRPDDPPGYRLRKLLGRGAFGSVWLAREAATGKRVAVKVFRHVRALDWALLTREAEKLAALDASRHVVRLLAVGWDADPPYYVMEYLPEGAPVGETRRRRPAAAGGGGAAGRRHRRRAGPRPRQRRAALRPEARQRAAGRRRHPPPVRLRPGPGVRRTGRRRGGRVRRREPQPRPGHPVLHAAGADPPRRRPGRPLGRVRPGGGVP